MKVYTRTLEEGLSFFFFATLEGSDGGSCEAVYCSRKLQQNAKETTDGRVVGSSNVYSNKWAAPLFLSLLRRERVVEIALLIRPTSGWGSTWVPASPSDGPGTVWLPTLSGHHSIPPLDVVVEDSPRLGPVLCLD